MQSSFFLYYIFLRLRTSKSLSAGVLDECIIHTMFMYIFNVLCLLSCILSHIIVLLFGILALMSKFGVKEGEYKRIGAKWVKKTISEKSTT